MYSLSKMKRKLDVIPQLEIGDLVVVDEDEYLVDSLNPTSFSACAPNIIGKFFFPIENVMKIDDWRVNLAQGDPVDFLFNGQWFPGVVQLRTPQGILLVRPSFTQLEVRCTSKCVRMTKHAVSNHANDLYLAMFSETSWLKYMDIVNSELIVERFDVVDQLFSVVTMDGTYLSDNDITSWNVPPVQQRILLGTLDCAEMNISSMEDTYIYPSIREMMSFSHELWDIVDPNIRLESAIEHKDQSYIRLMTEITEAERNIYDLMMLFRRSWCAVPYLQFEIYKGKLQVFWTGVSTLQPWKMRKIFDFLCGHFGTPTPQLSVVLEFSDILTPSQCESVRAMHVFETSNVCTTFLKEINGLPVCPYAGVVVDELPVHHGGVLCTGPGSGKTLMVIEIMRIRPMRTLIVVPVCLLEHWALHLPEHALYHGPKKSLDSNTVLTTCATLLKGIPGNFDRLVLDEAQLVQQGSRAFEVLCNLDIQTRWYVSSSPDFRESCEFLNVFPFCPGFEVPEAELPHAVEGPGCPFEYMCMRINVETPMHNLSCNDSNIFRYDSTLLPAEKVHEEVFRFADSFDNICKHVGRQVDINDCAVCLSEIKPNSVRVTGCGHAFCHDCCEQLRSMALNCPLCRGQILPLAKIGKPDASVFAVGKRMFKRRTVPSIRSFIVKLAVEGLRMDDSEHDPLSIMYCTRSTTICKDLCQRGHQCLLLRNSHGLHFNNVKVLIFVDNVEYYKIAEIRHLVNRFCTGPRLRVFFLSSVCTV